MKKYFITGLVILLPLALTVVIITFIFNMLTVPFLGLVKSIFDRPQFFERDFFLLHTEALQNLLAQSLILISLFLVVILLGMIARWFFFKSLLKFAEFIFKRIPLVSSIYKICQDVIKTIFTSKTNSFKQVVLVRFPNSETYSMGLITRENLPCFAETSYSDNIAVFVPTTPNPTSGFLVMFKRSDVIYLDMKVEDAFKYVVSCGVISPTFAPTVEPVTVPPIVSPVPSEAT